MYAFKNILFYARGEHVQSSLGQAVRLARRAQAKLVVVDAIDALSTLEKLAVTAVMPAKEMQELRREKCRRRLEGLVEKIHRKDVSIETKVLEGRPFIEVIRDVLRHERDLVIKPDQHGRSLGSDDMHLLRKCPCPVWITKEDEETRYKEIMAAVDLDDRSETNARLNDEILNVATSLADAEDTKLHVVSVWYVVGEDVAARRGIVISDLLRDVESERRQQLSALLAKHECPSGRTKSHLVKGFANEVVAEVARTESVDLLVMGSVGRVGVPGFFMGNTAETILNQVTCSVLTIKPPGFLSPVSLE